MNRLTLGALHVVYELGQMVDAALRIDGAPDAVTENALLESALLHARTLIEFLLGLGRDTDIGAEQLAPGWRLDDEVARTELKARKVAIDQNLAHLTWARVEEGEHLWPYALLTRDIVDHLRAFADDERLLPEAAGLLRLELQRIDQVAAVGLQTTFFISESSTTTTSSSGTVISSWQDPLEFTAFAKQDWDDGCADDGDAG